MRTRHLPLRAVWATNCLVHMVADAEAICAGMSWDDCKKWSHIMSELKQFKIGDHVNSPLELNQTPRLINRPPSNAIPFSIRGLFDAIVDEYKDGTDESHWIDFKDDGLEIVEIDGECEKMSDKVASVQKRIDDLSCIYGVTIEWKEPESRVYGSSRCKWTVRCVFKTA